MMKNRMLFVNQNNISRLLDDYILNKIRSLNLINNKFNLLMIMLIFLSNFYKPVLCYKIFMRTNIIFVEKLRNNLRQINDKIIMQKKYIYLICLNR